MGRHTAFDDPAVITYAGDRLGPHVGAFRREVAERTGNEEALANVCAEAVRQYGLLLHPQQDRERIFPCSVTGGRVDTSDDRAGKDGAGRKVDVLFLGVGIRIFSRCLIPVGHDLRRLFLLGRCARLLRLLFRRRSVGEEIALVAVRVHQRTVITLALLRLRLLLRSLALQLGGLVRRRCLGLRFLQLLAEVAVVLLGLLLSSLRCLKLCRQVPYLPLNLFEARSGRLLGLGPIHEVLQRQLEVVELLALRTLLGVERIQPDPTGIRVGQDVGDRRLGVGLALYLATQAAQAPDEQQHASNRHTDDGPLLFLRAQVGPCLLDHGAFLSSAGSGGTSLPPAPRPHG